MWGMGSILYLKTDPFQYPRVLINIKLQAGGTTIEYGLGFGDEDPTYHYEVEISETIAEGYKTDRD